MRQPRLLNLTAAEKHMQVVISGLSDHLLQVDTNVGRICARLGWLPLDAEKALEVILKCHTVKYLKPLALGTTGVLQLA